MEQLNSSSFEAYALEHYINVESSEPEEFYSDLKRFKYLKKLLNKYQETGMFSERLILNHVIVLKNLFGIKPTLNLLEFKIEALHWPALKPCLRFLNYIDDNEYLLIQTDPVVKRILERI